MQLRQINALRLATIELALKLAVAARWALREPGKPHGLGTGLTVSLTSFPPRYPTLHLTLKCLLTQSVAANDVILWVADADLSSLPESTLKLQDSGLVIRTCPDCRSYKKLIYSIAEFPQNMIVTADDDVYYGRDWLKLLVDAANLSGNEIIGHRGHEITFDGDGFPRPYNQWKSETANTAPSDSVFLTGVGGILYPPGSLAPEAADYQLAKEICPTADDVWFHFMGRQKKTVFRRVGRPWKPRSWQGSQTVNLTQLNVSSGGNDNQIANAIKRFGIQRY